jgi:hypothetical protein
MEVDYPDPVVGIYKSNGRNVYMGPRGGIYYLTKSVSPRPVYITRLAHIAVDFF